MPRLFNNFYKNKRILITGHTGFKGSWLSLWLYRFGAKVIGYAFEPPTRPNLFEICSLKDKLISLTGDIRDLKKLKNVFIKYQPEIVFHLAAQSLVRESYKNPVETYETNIMGTVNILEAIRKTNSVKSCIIVSSDKCYENKNNNHKYIESDPLGGYDPYSSSKGCVELVTKAYLKSFFNLKDKKIKTATIASARAGNVIGGGDWNKDRLIPDCIKAIIKNKPLLIRYPNAIRPWQHVLEPLYGYLLLAKKLYLGNKEFVGAWNFGAEDKDSKQVRWLVKKISRLWGKDFVWRDYKGHNNLNESQFLKLNSYKAKNKLRWQTQWDLELALEKTVEWYKAYCQNKEMLNISLDQIKSYESGVNKKG